MSRRFALAACVSAFVVTAVAPAAALAGTMRGSGEYEGDPGANAVTATFNGASMVFVDPAGISVVAGACVASGPTSASCPYDPGYRLDLVRGDDSFTYVAGAQLPAVPAGTRLFSVSGGPGADVLTGSPESDDLTGDGRDENYDEPSDPAGNDTLLGNGGDDDLHDDDGASNRIEGGAGRDETFIGSSKAANTILGGSGNDLLGGGGGNETIDGEDGDDTINGGDGDDLVRGSEGKDDIEGGGGQDVTDGGPGDDFVEASFHGGGCSTDTLIGGPGRDSLYAACGVPTLKMRDGAKDEARCLPKITTAVVERDRVDEVEGGACESKVKCGKKAANRPSPKKGAAAAGRSKKAKKCKRKKGRRK